ncbi:MAG: ribonuclease-3 [Saprospiraceae bacterium]
MIREIYNFYFSKDKDLAQKLRNILGFTPKKLSLFKLAFYHKSMNDEQTQNNQHNERLEYLGDSILSTIVAEYLFKKYPVKDEGFLTKMRSKIVMRKTLNSLASEMGLDIILSNYSQGKLSKSMMGNAFEAMVGAIYLEKGFDDTKDYIINDILLKHLDIHALEVQDENFKSQLLEWGQKNNVPVDYKLLSKYKQDKRDRFKVAVYVDGSEVALADDFNKKSAEQSASKMALKRLKITKPAPATS